MARRSLTDVFSNAIGTTEEEEREENAPVKEKGQADPQDQEEKEAPALETQKEKEEGLIARIKKKKEQKKVEDTHTRQTFLVRKDLKKELDKLFRKYGYGFKTAFINEAIEKQLERVWEEEKRQKK